MKAQGGAVFRTAAIVLAMSAPAVAGADSGALEYLEGGSLSSEARVSVGFLYGAGGRPDGLGSRVSTVRSGVASVSGNPAGLAYLSANGLLLDVLPPIGASVSDMVHLEDAAASAIDDAVEDVAAHGLDPVYPVLDANVGQQAGVISGAIAVRAGPVVLGAAIEEPVFIGLDLVQTGIEAFAAGVKSEGEGDIEIELRCFAEAAAQVSLEIEKTTLSAGSEVARGVALGASVSRYHASATATAVLRADGIVDYGGQEHAFNDPDDPWDNELGFEGSGAYRGDAIGWSAGASWRARDWLTVDALYVGVPRLSLEGSYTTVENMIPAAEDGGLELEEISASQPTLTERTETVERDPLILHLPSYVGAAVSIQTGRVVTTLEYRRYSGLLGFDLKNESEAIEPTDGFGLEADFGGVRVGGGVIRGTLKSGSAKDGCGGDVLIPLANLGYQLQLSESMTLDLLVVAVPLQVLRLSFAHEF
jgi:hypothetical protein